MKIKSSFLIPLILLLGCGLLWTPSQHAVSGHPLLQPVAVAAARNAKFFSNKISGTASQGFRRHHLQF
jgi:hypothetical protein